MRPSTLVWSSPLEYIAPVWSSGRDRDLVTLELRRECAAFRRLANEHPRHTREVNPAWARRGVKREIATGGVLQQFLDLV